MNLVPVMIGRAAGKGSPDETNASVALRMSFALAFIFVCAASPATEDSTSETENFLDKLLGDWHGEAVRTPIGPNEYDINFSRQADGSVAGVADTGPSLHYWTFMHSDGELRVRFLTTFRGNTKPIWLKVESRSPETFKFRAEQPPYLRVDVSPDPSRTTIGVFLHEAPHVDIVLTPKP